MGDTRSKLLSATQGKEMRGIYLTIDEIKHRVQKVRDLSYKYRFMCVGIIDLIDRLVELLEKKENE